MVGHVGLSCNISFLFLENTVLIVKIPTNRIQSVSKIFEEFQF